MNEEEKRTVYHIPDNFAEDGKILKGMVAWRNALEAALLLFLFFLLFRMLPFSIHIRCYLVFPLGIPAVIFAVIGINGESLLSYLFYAVKYFFSRRVIAAPSPKDRQLRERRLLKAKQKKRREDRKKQRVAARKEKRAARAQRKKDGGIYGT